MPRKNNIFREVPVKKQKRNHFDLSHEVKMSGKFGYLYPILTKETLPGDKWYNTSSVMARLAPMLAPIYHRLDITVHFFAVPVRLLTDSWEDFITGGQDGTLAPVLPYVTPAGIATHSGDLPAVAAQGGLWDYLGLPPIAGGGPWSTQKLSVLPFRAYAKIWNDYYRDPNFDTELDLSTELEGDVSEQTFDNGLFTLRRRGWEKDYFTSALAQAQRGLEVLMPLAGVAEAGDVTYKVSDVVDVNEDPLISQDLQTNPLGQVIGTPGGITGMVRNIDEIRFDNSATSINDFRRALAIQTWLENNARAGARYNEQIYSHFQTRVPDYRVQRAEYLGGGRQPITIREVVATANTEDTMGGVTPVGDLAGHGISVGNTNRFGYYSQEHCIIMGILSVMPRTAYSQGVERMWTREDKFDYAWPELAHIGEQEILNRELIFTGDAAGDATAVGTFGYIPRYSEYKFSNDRIAGDFRSNLGFWHLTRNFNILAGLGEGFTTMYENGDAPGSSEETYRRIFYVQDGTDYIWMQIYHNLQAKRPLPYFGVPKIQ